MVRLISKQRKTTAGLKLTKLFDIDDFSVAKDSGNVLIIIIYCYLIIIIIILLLLLLLLLLFWFFSFFCRRFTSNVLKHIGSRAFDNVNMCYMYVYYKLWMLYCCFFGWFIYGRYILPKIKCKAFIEFFYTGPTVCVFRVPWLINIFHDHCGLPDTVKPPVITMLLEIYKDFFVPTICYLPPKATLLQGPVKYAERWVGLTRKVNCFGGHKKLERYTDWSPLGV